MSKSERILLIASGALLNSAAVMSMARLYPEVNAHHALVALLEGVMFLGGALAGYAYAHVQPVAAPGREKEGD